MHFFDRTCFLFDSFLIKLGFYETFFLKCVFFIWRFYYFAFFLVKIRLSQHSADKTSFSINILVILFSYYPKQFWSDKLLIKHLFDFTETFPFWNDAFCSSFYSTKRLPNLFFKLLIGLISFLASKLLVESIKILLSRILPLIWLVMIKITARKVVFALNVDFII